MSENDKKQDSHPAEDSKDFKIPHSRDRYLYSIVSLGTFSIQRHRVRNKPLQAPRKNLKTKRPTNNTLCPFQLTKPTLESDYLRLCAGCRYFHLFQRKAPL